MDAPTRVLKALDQEEPDRVPAFESAFTNNTIMRHYGVPVTGGISSGIGALKYLPLQDGLSRIVVFLQRAWSIHTSFSVE
jgi:hypothetical protein